MVREDSFEKNENLARKRDLNMSIANYGAIPDESESSDCWADLPIKTATATSSSSPDNSISGKASQAFFLNQRDGTRQNGANSNESGASVRLAANSIRLSIRNSLRSMVDAGFVLDGMPCSVRDIGGQATILSEVFNICKNLVGGGVLSLSGGIALFSNNPMALFAASFWIVLFGLIFAYFCLLIAKVCNITKAATFRECWQDTMGDVGGFIVALVNAVKPALGNLAYSTILSQTLSSLFQTVGINLSRIECLFLVTLLVLLPLCLLKNLAVLTPFSMLGTAGILLTAGAMVVRCFDGSYQPGGIYFDDIAVEMRPEFGSHNRPFSIQALPFICMVFEAYVMHYNSPRFYTELKCATIPRFTGAVGGAFGMSAVIYVIIAGAGFFTFGGNSNGYILNNYSPYDPLATVCRLAVAVSTMATFPIAFIGFRDGILDALEVPPARQTGRNLNALTVVLLTIITVFAVFTTDLGMINAVGGGSLATILVFVFPVLMYEKAIQMLGSRASLWEHREVQFAYGLMVFGLIVGFVGVIQSVTSR